MKNICVVTGTRAEYGLLRWIMEGIKVEPNLQLQVVATGMHLSPEFGLTYQEIEADGFLIDKKVEILTSADTASGIAKSMGLGMISFADVLSELKPDLIVVLGDRFEIFSAVAAALVACIPVAHLQGGEKTEGAFDEAFRHSITKMSHFHFVAVEEYRRRVIQLGEQPKNVFVVGKLGVDNIKRIKLLDRIELEKSLGINLGKKSLLITFHPVTLEKDTASVQMKELLSALSNLRDTQLIFTYPNADTDGRILIKLVEDFVAIHDNAYSFNSLGQLRYLSCISHVDGVVGNSSSGLSEVPSFKKGTVNIGNRQKGRLQASSVINCAPTRDSIAFALNKLYSKEYQDSLNSLVNPYSESGASEKVVKILKSVEFEHAVNKVFYDLPIDSSVE